MLSKAKVGTLAKSACERAAFLLVAVFLSVLLVVVVVFCHDDFSFIF